MPKKIKKPTKTHVIFILDESGSMSTTASDVRGGFNSYVEKLKTDGNAYTLTALKFGSNVRPLFANLPLEQVPALTTKNYMPLDSTALYDAIGHALANAKEEDQTICIIMTDGEENASREFSKEAIIAKIKEREEAGNWTFAYMGADQDAWAHASHLGFAQGNVMSYASAATGSAFDSLSTATSGTASRGTSSRTFFSGDQGTSQHD